MFGLQLPVGVGSSNKSHDVTLIQIVFFYLTHQTKWGPKPLYEGRIDGRFGPKTEAALAAFLTRVGRPADRPRIESSGPNYDALKKALPRELIGLDCVPETNQAFCDCKGQSGADDFARETMTKIPLPKKEREALAKFQTAMGSGMGLGVALEKRGISPGGSFTATLVTPNAIWFDPQHKRFRDNNIPGPARQFLLYHLARGHVWKVGGGMGLDILSVKQYPALKGNPKFGALEKEILGIPETVSDPVAQACAAGSARMIGASPILAHQVRQELIELAPAIGVESKRIATHIEKEASNTPTVETFANKRRGSLIRTSGSGTRFRNVGLAWTDALFGARALASRHYPERYRAGLMIPELGVEIIEENRRFYYEGFIVGTRSLSQNSREVGTVGWKMPAVSKNVAARGHMHWLDNEASGPDIQNAQMYGQMRRRADKEYDEYVGGYSSDRRYYSNGKTYNPSTSGQHSDRPE